VTILDLRKRGWLISMWNSLACSLSLLPINKYNKIINHQTTARFRNIDPFSLLSHLGWWDGDIMGMCLNT
jgi:hypothetical protein